jgi:predicted TIM-barrel fold metal-dependent hydrolase
VALEAVNALPVGDEDKANILHRNAERLFNLTGAAA